MSRLSSQRGVALLIVLLIVALVTVLATEMGARLQLNIQRTVNLKDNNQAYWYAMGAESLARRSLYTLMQDTGDKIALNQPWAQAFSYPVENGVIQARLEDMQSCFNLNALQPDTANARSAGSGSSGINVSASMTAFHQLLLAAELELSSYDADTLRDSLADWLDDDSQMRSYGAEDSTYESKSPAYLAANRLMSSQSELRLINGVSPKWLNALLPLVCVIPQSNTLSVNVNTLTPERAAVLAGITGLSLPAAQNLIDARPPDGWDNSSDFLAEPAISAIELSDEQKSWFSVTTEYFILHSKTRYNNARFTMTSVLKVASDSPVTVVRREFAGVN